MTQSTASMMPRSRASLMVLLVQTALVGSENHEGPLLSTYNVLQVTVDLLILFDCAVVATVVVSVFDPGVSTRFGGATVMSNVSENLTLAFTFVYSFGQLAYKNQGGVRQILKEDNWELFWRIVFATHEYVFMTIESSTGLPWEFVQAVDMQLTIIPCVCMTIGDHPNFHVVRTTLKKIPSFQRDRGTAIETKGFDASSIAQPESGSTTALNN